MKTLTSLCLVLLTCSAAAQTASLSAAAPKVLSFDIDGMSAPFAPLLQKEPGQ